MLCTVESCLFIGGFPVIFGTQMTVFVKGFLIVWKVCPSTLLFCAICIDQLYGKIRFLLSEAFVSPATMLNVFITAFSVLFPRFAFSWESRSHTYWVPYAWRCSRKELFLFSKLSTCKAIFFDGRCLIGTIYLRITTHHSFRRALFTIFLHRRISRGLPQGSLLDPPGKKLLSWSPLSNHQSSLEIP